MSKTQLRLVTDARAVAFEKRGSGIAKHYVFTVRVQWSDGSKLIINRRYDDFFNLHADLLKKFPLEAGVISKKDRVLPELPKKIYIGRSQVRKVAEQRLHSLDQYLQAIVKLTEKILSSPPVEKFFEARPEDIHRTATANDKSGNAKDATPKAGQFSQISGPMRLEHYRAIGDYKKQNREQIDLKKGKEYEIIQKDTTGWWLVKSDLGQGWAPASFLEPVNHKIEDDYLPKSKNERVVSVREFRSQGEFGDELSFPKHAVMKVIYKTLDGWWYVRYNEKNGYVPAAYLTALREDSTWMDEGEEEEAGEDSTVASRKGSVRQKYFGAPPRRESLMDVKAVQKRHTTTKISPLALQKAMQLAGLAEAKPVEENKVELEGIVEEEEEEEDSGEGEDDAEEDMVESEPYRAAADYTAESEEEVSFKTGDMVDVVKKEDNGWWLVVVNEQAEGWAPATYLEPVNAQEAENTGMMTSSNDPCADSEADKVDYVTQREYVAQDAEELSFPEGVIVQVLQKYLDGWWYASYDRKRGYVPASHLDCLEMTSKAADVKVPGLAVKPPTLRKNKFLPSRGSILDKDSLYSALKKHSDQVQVPAAVKEEDESDDSSRRSSFSKPRLQRSRPSSATATTQRRMPIIPSRPTTDQLEKCTISVRGALQRVSEGVVKPTAVRPSGGIRHRSSSPHHMEQFKPVSDGSEESSGGEPSPGTKRRSQNLSPDYTPGNPPPLPPSRRSGSPDETNSYSSTCALLQQQPGCSVSPRSSPKFHHEQSPKRGPPALPKSRPVLPPSRPLSGSLNQETKQKGVGSQGLDIDQPEARPRSHSQGKQYREVYYV